MSEWELNNGCLYILFQKPFIIIRGVILDFVNSQTPFLEIHPSPSPIASRLAKFYPMSGLNDGNII